MSTTSGSTRRTRGTPCNITTQTNQEDPRQHSNVLRMCTTGSTICSGLNRCPLRSPQRRLLHSAPTTTFETYVTPNTGSPSLRINYAIGTSGGWMYHKLMTCRLICLL